MAGQNDFLIFDQSGDNMLTQQNYASDTDRASGYRTGLARSIVMNKVLHQTSMLAHALGELAKDNGQVATDTGSVANLKTALSNALMGANIDLSNLSSTGNNRFVNRTGDTMTGQLKVKKSGLGINYCGLDLDFTTAPSSDMTVPAYRISDKYENRMGGIEYRHRADGGHGITISDKKNNTATYAILEVGWDLNGNAYSNAITPLASSNSTNIATTAWVRTRIAGSVTYTSSTRTLNIG